MQNWLGGDGPTGVWATVGIISHVMLLAYAVLAVAADIIRRLAPTTYQWARKQA